jgi:hypothetical protein
MFDEETEFTNRAVDLYQGHATQEAGMSALVVHGKLFGSIGNFFPFEQD